MQTLKHRATMMAFAGVLILLGAWPARAQYFEINGSGLYPERAYVSNAPWEFVDTLNGSLVLQFTDLVLPGNGGREFRIQRTFNLKSYQWTMGIAGLVMHISTNWPGPGWYCPMEPLLWGADGALIQAIVVHDCSYAFNRFAMTDRFGWLDRAGQVLFTPDGAESFYDNGNLVWYLDNSGNSITISGWGTATLTVTQDLGNGESRTITMPTGSLVPNTVGTQTQTLSYNGKNTTYQGTKNADGSSALLVTLADGTTTWRYDLASNWLDLTVTTPAGGKVKYGAVWADDWWDQYCDDYDCYPSSTTMVTSRQAFDRNNALLGTWQYSYSDVLSGSTVVTAPNGTTTTYAYCIWCTNSPSYARAAGNRLPEDPYGYGFGGQPQNNFLGRFMLLLSRTLKAPAGTVLETESFTYVDLSLPCGFCFGGQLAAVPGVSSRAITRNGLTYTTQYNYNGGNYNDHHQPYQIVESGQFSRTTTRSYQQTFEARVLTETITVNGESVTLTSSWGYDPEGLTTVETIHGVTTSLTYSGGNVASRTVNGHTTSYQYHWGVVSQITLPNGAVISREINQDGLVTSETRAGRTTTLAYDNLFRPISTQPPGGSSISAPTTIQYFSDHTVVTRGSSTVTTDLDSFGRPTCTVNSVNVKTCATYDVEGRKLSESLPAYGTPPSNTYTTFTYDFLGRLTQKTNPNGTSVSFTHGAVSCGSGMTCPTLTIQDENGQSTVRQFKAFGHPDDARLTKVTDAAGSVWSYTYSPLGQMTRVDEPGDLVRTWTYGTQGAVENLLLSDSQPESGTTNYAYIAGTRLLYTKTDAKQTAFTYTYDANDRLLQVSGGGRTTTFAYEPGSDNRTSMSVTGGALTTFTYDAAGRAATRSDVVNDTTFTQTFAYNTLDQLTTLTYPTGRPVGYEYDSGGRITRVFNAATQANYASTFSYHTSGAVLEYVGANSMVHQFAFDPLTYRLSSIGVVGALSLGYSYDAVGNVTQITDGRGASYFQNFGYDQLNRLITMTGFGYYPSPCWSYDTRGNRTTCSTTSYEYYAGTNRLKNQGGIEFTFDANGNVIGEGARSFAYTPDNQVASTTLGGATVSYQYDADGWRVLTHTIGQPDRYVVRAPNGGVLTEQTETWTRDSIYAGGRLIGWAQSDGQVYDVTTDAIGSVRMVSNAAQQVIERHDYLPFGEEWNPPASISPVKFAGKERDTLSETQRDYFLARYTRPNSGRFTSPDHWMFADPTNPQSWNLYVYVLNNPLRFIDPDGHDVKCRFDDGYDSDGNITFSQTCSMWLRASDFYPGEPDESGGNAGGAGGGGGGSPAQTARQGVIRPQSPPPPCSVSGASLDSYLAGKRSPIAGEGGNLFNAGSRYDVDPRFVVSLAGAETTFGNHITRGQYNAWNWLYNGPGRLAPFASWAAAINTITGRIALGPNYFQAGRNTTSSIYSTYCNGPDCVNGLRNVNRFLTEQGGNPNSLRFPCRRE